MGAEDKRWTYRVTGVYKGYSSTNSGFASNRSAASQKAQSWLNQHFVGERIDSQTIVLHRTGTEELDA